MWDIDQMVITKTGDSSGEASVKLTADDGTALFINKIMIDLSSGANAIGIAKVQGTPVVSGKAIDDIKDEVLEVFQTELSDATPGMYRVDSHGVESI